VIGTQRPSTSEKHKVRKAVHSSKVGKRKNGFHRRANTGSTENTGERSRRGGGEYRNGTTVASRKHDRGR
jgi:hypothetical protein